LLSRRSETGRVLKLPAPIVLLNAWPTSDLRLAGGRVTMAFANRFFTIDGLEESTAGTEMTTFHKLRPF